jgi:tungstate transport system ATP-binding protein
MASLHRKQGGVGLVFQKPMMFRRTVRANLVHALKSAGVPRAEIGRTARTSCCPWRACRIWRIARRGFCPVANSRNLSVVRALAANPRVLLLDEPTASLDPRATHDIENLIVKARSEGREGRAGDP